MTFSYSCGTISQPISETSQGFFMVPRAAGFWSQALLWAILIHSCVLGKADGVESEDPSFNYRNIYRRNM